MLEYYVVFCQCYSIILFFGRICDKMTCSLYSVSSPLIYLALWPGIDRLVRCEIPSVEV